MHKRPAVAGVVGALSVALLLVVASELGAQTPPPLPRALPKGEPAAPPKSNPPTTQQQTPQTGTRPLLPVPESKTTTVVPPNKAAYAPAIVFEQAVLSNFADDNYFAQGSGNHLKIDLYRRGDGKPHRLTVWWLVKDIPDAERQQIFNCQPATCYSFQVNGVDHPAEISHKTITVGTVFDVPDNQWPIKIQLRARAPNAVRPGQTADWPFRSSIVEIAANRFDYFEAKLYPTFKHPRCTTCHHMGDTVAIWAQHKGNTVVTPSGFPNPKPDDTASGCDGCHFDIRQSAELNGGKAKFLGQLGAFTDYEWKSPAFTKNINWEKKVDAKDVCTTVVGHLPTQAQLHKHFHNDARLAWAVTAADVQFTGLGYAGSGPQQQKDSAPPGNYAKFLAIVDRWLEIGFPCKP